MPGSPERRDPVGRYDVVVVGAGLAGLQAARLLGGQGLRVLLVDRKPAPSAFVHTTGIFVRRTLDDFALPEDCLGPPLRRVVLYSPARRAVAFTSPRDEFRVGRLARLYDRWLEDAVRQGVEYAASTRYIGAEPAGPGLRLRLEGPRDRREVETRFLIGADGARSGVARDLGLDRNREWLLAAEEVYEGVPPAGPPACHCFLDPALSPGYLAWIVHDGEELHLGVAGYPDRFHPGTALVAFRRDAAGRFDLARGRLRERRGGRIPVGGVLARIASPRGLLVGDAAGAVSPLTAGGLDPCLRLSALAADVTAAYLASGDPRVLDVYRGDRFHRRFLTRRWLRRLLAASGSPVLELACGVLRLPVLHRLGERVFFGRGSFPDVEPLRRRVRLLAGSGTSGSRSGGS